MLFCHSGVRHNFAGLPPTTDFPFLDFPLGDGEHTGRGTPTDLRGALAATAAASERKRGASSTKLACMEYEIAILSHLFSMQPVLRSMPSF